MENLDSNVVVSAKSASIILGVAATGYAESPSGEYKTDMGFYSFYLKEPEAPTVHASKGAFSNKVQVQHEEIKEIIKDASFDYTRCYQPLFISDQVCQFYLRL